MTAARRIPSAASSLLVAATLLAALALQAAGQTAAVTGPTPATTKVGSRAVLRVSVAAAPAEVRLGPLPSVDGLRITAGVPRAASDGSGGTEIEVALVPEREGAFALPPLTVDVTGTSLVVRPGPLEAVRDPEAESLAFVEVRVPATCRAGEAVIVLVRVGLDADLFREGLVPLFSRRLDVPVQVEAPWLAASTRPLDAQAAGTGGRRTFALDATVATGALDEGASREGRAFVVLEHARVLVAGAPGALPVPAPAMRFAYATRFEESFLGRRALDRHEGFVLGRSATIQVLPLPEDGRPAGFAGAVGRFTVDGAVPDPVVGAGGTLSFLLRVAGEGNLAAVAPPDLRRVAGFEAFHVLGVVEAAAEERSALSGARTFRYDLAPLHAGVRTVPAVPFPFYDPSPDGGYRTARTDPVPVTVRGVAGAAPAAPPRPVPEGRVLADIRTGDDHGSDRTLRLPPGVLAGALAAPWCLAACVLLARRAARRRVVDPAAARALGAADVFRAAFDDPDADTAGAFAEYLASRARQPVAAVIGPDLPARLAAAGVPDALAREAAALLERLVAAGYGGRLDPADRDAARRAVDALERALAPGKEDR